MINEREVAEVAERHLGMVPRSVLGSLDGFGHLTFVVDEAWVFRFAKTKEVAKRDRVEQQVLPFIADSVSFKVPEIEHRGVMNGLPYVGYRLLPGRPLEANDVPDLIPSSRLGRFLHELHAVDTRTVSDVLGIEASAPRWRDRYRDLRTRAPIDLVDTLDPALLEQIDLAFGRFLEAPFGFDPVVVHGDLGTSHILVDDTSGLVGLLDFEAVTIGDPAVDFVGMIITLGPDGCRAVIDAYPGRVDDGFWERVLGYWWIGSLSAVLHGVATDEPSITTDGIGGLSQRLSSISLP